MTNRKIEALQEAAAQKAKESEERVEKALEKMIKQGQKITFSTVAQVANVSTAYLYKQPDLRSRIEALRDQQKQRSKPKQPPPASDNSKGVIIQSLWA
jgi:predicted transcriptional regulator